MCVCVCAYVCECVCVCVGVCVYDWQKGAVIRKQSQTQLLFFIYLEIKTIHVLNNFIHQAKSSSACFRMVMRSSINKYDFNDME